MTDEISGKPRVPVGELEALVEEWNYRIKGILDFQGRSPEANEIQKCKEELEAVLEEYQHE